MTIYKNDATRTKSNTSSTRDGLELLCERSNIQRKYRWKDRKEEKKNDSKKRSKTKVFWAAV